MCANTIHYDITDILEYARHHATVSGIQRVSIQLISHIVNKHGADRLRLIAWHPLRQRIVSFDATYFSGAYTYDQQDFCRHFGLIRNTIGGASLKSYLDRKYGRSWRRSVHHARLVVANNLTEGRTFKKRDISFAQRHTSSGRMNEGLSLEPGDLVFIVGATWNFDEYLSALAHRRRENGIVICQFVHDLIPLLAPEHVTNNNVRKDFSRWLKNMSRNTDYFLTNSQATKRDLDAWLAENGVDVDTGVLPLAHQFGDSPRQPSAQFAPADFAPDDEEISVRVRNAARLPYVLCVGSIESRKNIWSLANVWKQIHTKLGEATPRLIFAGNPGWLREDFDDFIRGTGSLYGFIRIIERPSDAELAFLYQRCLFSVFPSYKEGWGLPVGEGLWFGRPVVTSNTSAMPEVGGALADYIDPTSWESMEAALLKMITDADYREKRTTEIAEARLRSWSDVADDLWQEFIRLTSSRDGAFDKAKCDSYALVTPSTSHQATKVSQQDVDSLPWWHSIDLGHGIVTKGGKSLDAIRAESDVVFRKGVAGKTVLDIGAWNGAFSFEAERRGAAEVTALDHHVWKDDINHRKAFELARAALGSHVKDITCDIYDIKSDIGQFDIVLFLGIFYHLQNPLLAIEIAGRLTKELLVVETYVALNDLKSPAMRFFPGNEVDGDASIWWGPNVACLRAMFSHLGFSRIETSTSPIAANRVIMHAWR